MYGRSGSPPTGCRRRPSRARRCANARTYRAERRARADLEALLETLGKPDMVSKINRTPPPGGREAPRTCATAGWCGCVCDRRAKSANPATPWA